MIFPWLPEPEIEARAADLLQRTFGPGLDRSRPIDLEEVLCYLSEKEQLSFDLDAELRAEDGQLILGKTQPLRRRILISGSLRHDPDPGRARFTVAHELGHWVLHRPLFVARARELSLFGPDEIDGSFEFVGLNGAVFPSPGRAKIPREEWQANRFAISLLMDPGVLRVEFERRFREPPVAWRSPQWRIRSSSLREHARRLAGCCVDDLPPIREIFGVSAEAMAIALETRGYAVADPPLI